MTFEDINDLGTKRIPFLFVCDFLAQNIDVIPLENVSKSDIEFSICTDLKTKRHVGFQSKEAVAFDVYKQKFDAVIEKIKAGETYLLNLTQPTLVKSELTLKEIYDVASAPYKLRYKDKFVCFSPESFVRIKGSKIETFPMKGTIDASIEGAKEKILGDEKETAEHVMVVDLLRNDLSIVAKDVRVERFRYITEIEAGEKRLLQVSSHISGSVGEDWQEKVGDILKNMLPAGSISGTPKKSTLEIIRQVEGYERGYFSGVFGVYDGFSLDSAVMIRFIEKSDNGYIYKSGGGITLDSCALSEYNELLDKVYLP